MNIKDFAELLRDEVAKQLTEADGVGKIDIQEVVKNNNMLLTGLILRDKSNVAPVIYVDNQFSRWLNGTPLFEIAEEVIDIYHKSKYQGPEVDDFLDYNKMKNMLIVSVMNTNRNIDALDELPHIEVEDVSIIARIEVTQNGQHVGTVKVNKQILETWGINEKELFDQAWSNMKKLYPPMCKDMVDVIKDMYPYLPEFVLDEMNSDKGKFYVIMTNNGLNGSCYGFNKEFLKDICNRLNTNDIYILPSSIDEVIVAPASKVDNPAKLSSIVEQVNGETVSLEDQLSNNSYYYDSITNELTTNGYGHELSSNYEVEQDEEEEIEADEDIEL